MERTAGNLTWDDETWVCTWRGQALKLTRCEFILVGILARHPGVVHTRNDLASRLEVKNRDGRAIDSFIKRIRAKFMMIDNMFDCIKSIYAMGILWTSDGQQYCEEKRVSIGVSGKPTIGPLVIECRWRGEKVFLTKMQLAFVAALIDRPGKVLTPQNLLDEMGKWDSTELIVDDVAKRVRAAFREVDPTFDRIETRHGIGFCWRAEYETKVKLTAGRQKLVGSRKVAALEREEHA